MVLHNDSSQHLSVLLDLLKPTVSTLEPSALKSVVQHFFVENNEQLESKEQFQNIAPVLSILIQQLGHREDDNAKVRFLPMMETENGEKFSTIAIIDDNRPFIVETMQMVFEKNALTLANSFSSMYDVQRDSEGFLLSILPYEGQTLEDGHVVESVTLYILQDYLGDDEAKRLNQIIIESFNDIRFVAKDWSAMSAAAHSLQAALRSNNVISKDVRNEEADFILWLEDAHFTFLGMRQSRYTGSGANLSIGVDWDQSLGILRNVSHEVFGGNDGSAHIQQHMHTILQNTVHSVHVFKAAMHSTVRRDVPLDAILIKRFDDSGVCIGDVLFVGLFAWSAYVDPLGQIPSARKKVQAVMASYNAEIQSYRGRQIAHLLENYSRDMMYQADFETLVEHISELRRSYRKREFVTLDYFNPFSSSQYFSVIMPRTHYSAALREQMIRYLQQYFDVPKVTYSAHLPESPMWRVDFRLFFGVSRSAPTQDVLNTVKAHLAEISQSTADRLRLILSKQYTPQNVSRLVHSYGSSFGVDYWGRNNEYAALFDIETLEDMESTGKEISGKLYKAESSWQVRLYNCGSRKIYLSEIMPMLERLDLEVRTEEPYDLNIAGRERCSVLVFTISNAVLEAGVEDDLLQNFSDSIDALFAKKTENDRYLKLVLGAGLTWCDIVILRSYAKYLRQIRITHSARFIADTLAQYPDVSRNLVRLFAARFDPKNHSADSEAMIEVFLQGCLNGVENIDQDRLLNRYMQLIKATLRTNFYQCADTNNAREAISFKIAPREVEGVPKPVPLREIFVYSPYFEAVHLRFGFVARGGLRWSDREEDFRTEILGLVKAQQVKNAVIVPMGSKGGFVLKTPTPDRAAFMAEGIKRYREFIASMLEITDSYGAGGSIRKPDDVICHDDDDPYLVVAADKGTATFSDFANEMSDKADFWLGDAFASGGSVGYDHKKMGITARGAWESVKRHFREFGHNTQTMPFEAVGVGDMSGDVFGNGMLLSEQIRLIGAFNHMHIFVDPDPDPSTSYIERRRLFDLPRSGWADYDKSTLSKGGMIFDRNVKTLTLTPEIQAKFDITEENITPNALIHRLLTMQSDLLWFGGIGTYIKADSENNLDVGDKANDAIRINGAEVGARVIGEGANLGVTQLGRIEYCMAGGRCNTDAIDNSAGVDCSDHEVNIKILLGSALSNGTLVSKDRVALLESMTDEVGELVLENNYAQTLSLSISESAAPKLLDMHQRVMQNFERIGELDRRLEGLPDDEEIERRRTIGQGLVRPELSVLLAYGKNIVYQTLQKSVMLDDPMLQGYLIQYFPKVLQEKFTSEIKDHQLRREIIATVITNTVINRSGVGFIIEMESLTGAHPDRICMAYLTVCEIFQLHNIWQETEALDNVVSSALQHKILIETTYTIKRMTEWLLRHAKQPLDVQGCVQLYGSGVEKIESSLSHILSEEAYQVVEERSARFMHPSIPDTLARRVGRLKVLSSACDVVNLATRSAQTIDVASKCYFAVSDRFALDRLRTMANEIHASDVWTAQALAASIDELWGLQFEISVQALKVKAKADHLDAWIAQRQDKFNSLDAQFNELFQRRQIDVAVLTVIQRQIRMLL